MLLLVLVAVFAFPFIAIEAASFVYNLELAPAPVVAESRSFAEIVGA